MASANRQTCEPETNPADGWPACESSPEITGEGRVALELLRIASLTWLILYHVVAVADASAKGGLAKAFHLLANAGYMGTDLFLALAGFLAVGGWARSGGAPAWLGRRLIRVFPALATFLVVYLYLIPHLIVALGGSPESLPNYSGLDRARHVQWTMWTMGSNFLMVSGQRMGAALEPHHALGLFAQLTVLVAFLLPSRKRLFYGAGAVAILGVVLRLLWLHDDAYKPYSFPLTRGDGFLLGAGVAMLLRSEATRERLLAWRGKLLVLSSAAMVLLLMVIRSEWIGSPWMKVVGYPTVAFWSASVVLYLATASKCPAPLRVLAGLGRVTYCAYFVKLPLCFVILRSWQRRISFPSAALLCVLGTWCVAIVWHTTLAQPLLRWGYRLVGQPRAS